ncbi:MAG: peptidoglycan DD-metalloendopeptidase family protein [Gammaproteobacteria bacterium]
MSKGDTLYSIAWQAGHDYRKGAAWNNLRWPYRIHPGQRISLRAPAAKHTKTTRKPSSSTRNTPSKYKKKPVKKSQVRKVRWAWPTHGKIIGYFSEKEPGKKGVDIAGRVGQPIKAAASGRVVYSGNGLRGYGNLIIIKHSETYFSAYAHNRKIFVEENQKVKLGQKIADMGNTGANKVMLHFEIRRNGRPINPLRYLPKT